MYDELIEKMRAVIDDAEQQDGWIAFSEILEWALVQKDIADEKLSQ